MSLSHWVGLLFFSCLVQLEWVAAAAGQVPRPSPECPSGPHSVGHLWTWQSRPCWGNHCHPVWQIWVSLISHYYLWLVTCFYIPVVQRIKKATRTQTPKKTPHDKSSNCLLPVCSVKACTTWKFGQAWRAMEGNPPPHLDVPAAAWQRTRWADLQKYSTILIYKHMSVCVCVCIIIVSVYMGKRPGWDK